MADDNSIASRELDGPNGRVLIRLGRPIERREAEWSCLVEVVAEGKQANTIEVTGADSLQALILGVGALRQLLAPDLASLSWLGQHGYTGVPLVLTDEEPGFLPLVEHLVHAEFARLLINKQYVHKKLGRKV